MEQSQLASPRTVAIVGASNDRSKFGNKAVRAFLRQGFQVYPVHPSASEIEGLPVFRSLREIPVAKLDMVSLYVPPAAALKVLEEIAANPPRELWLNPGVDAPEVVKRAAELGLDPIVACSILGVGENPHAD